MDAKNVLVIDDDEAILEELSETIVDLGHSSITASDGRYIDTSKLDDIDVVMLDLDMPLEDGLTVLHRMAAMPEAPALILMSGHGLEVLNSACVAAKARGLRVVGSLSKPISMPALRRLIDRQVVTTSVADTSTLNQAVLCGALEIAIENRGLPICFQPRVSALDFVFSGAEALLAGVVPGVGWVSPVEIISAAKTTPGLLDRLTLHVAKMSIDACAAWRAQGFIGAVSINVPPSTIISSQSMALITEWIAGAGLSREDVILELTEEDVYDESFDVLSALIRLRLSGFGLALDDVGKRSSGLSQLCHLPVSELKIDAEFFRDARQWDHQISSKAEMVAILLGDFGRGAGISVTAEGIESPDDYDLAVRAGAEFIQGYIVSPKLPLSTLIDVIPLLARRTRARALVV